jgi:ribosomal protein L37AE/L43A
MSNVSVYACPACSGPVLLVHSAGTNTWKCHGDGCSIAHPFRDGASGSFLKRGDFTVQLVGAVPWSSAATSGQA